MQTLIQTDDVLNRESATSPKEAALRKTSPPVDGVSAVNTDRIATCTQTWNPRGPILARHPGKPVD